MGLHVGVTDETALPRTTSGAGATLGLQIGILDEPALAALRPSSTSQQKRHQPQHNPQHHHQDLALCLIGV
jgi:hypothetical protein